MCALARRRSAPGALHLVLPVRMVPSQDVRARGASARSIKSGTNHEIDKVLTFPGNVPITLRPGNSAGQESPTVPGVLRTGIRKTVWIGFKHFHFLYFTTKYIITIDC